jgi:hypothetical protein
MADNNYSVMSLNIKKARPEIRIRQAEVNKGDVTLGLLKKELSDVTSQHFGPVLGGKAKWYLARGSKGLYFTMDAKSALMIGNETITADKAYSMLAKKSIEKRAAG